jgi:hypothetical protein
MLKKLDSQIVTLSTGSTIVPSSIKSTNTIVLYANFKINLSSSVTELYCENRSS